MSIKFTKDILDTENPFVDLLMYTIKILAFNCVIKDEYMANQNETTESAKAADLYIDCKEDNASIYLFDRIPEKYLKQVGVPDDQIKLYNSSGFDKFYIPKDVIWDANKGLYVDSGTHYERDLKPLLEKWYIEQFERNHYEGELNNYYRKIIGIPPVGEWGIPMRDYEYLLPDTFHYTGQFVHEIGTDACRELERLGVLDVIKAEYPDAEYLNYVTAGITPYDARNKLDFQILYMPTESDLLYENQELNPLTFRSIIEEFENKYHQNREYMITAVYTRSMEIGSSYYHSFMCIYLLIITMIDIITEVQSHLVKKDILNRRCCQYLFEMYNIPFYKQIPEKYQEKLVKNLHNLIKYKSSTTDMDELKYIFEQESVKIYKYYLLQVRKTDQYGDFIKNETTKLVGQKNNIIVHDTRTELISEPPERQPSPGALELAKKYNKFAGLDHPYPEGTWTTTMDDEDLVIKSTNDAITNSSNNSEEEKQNYGSTVNINNDYAERYIIWPFDYFLQKGNVIFVRVDDYVLKEGIDYTIFDYNKIRIKKSLLEGKTKITYDFYYDKDTIDEKFEVNPKYSIVTLTRKWDNAKKGQVFDLKPIPWDNYFLDKNDIIVSVHSVLLAPSMYKIDYKNCTFTINENISYAGYEVYAIIMNSNYAKPKFEKHAVVASEDDGQTKFYIPDPYPYYTLNENTFFVTLGNTIVFRERYEIIPSNEENKSYIKFTDGTKVKKGRMVVFNFLYSRNAFLHRINLSKKTITITCERHYQTEFDIKLPVNHYTGCNYCLYVKYLGWYLGTDTYTFTNNKLIILDESLAIKAGDTLELELVYVNKDSTLDENSYITVVKDFKRATTKKQGVFNIEFPVKHYYSKFNKLVVDVNGYPLRDDQYSVTYNGDYKGKIKITDWNVRPIKKGDKVNFTFFYNQDAEYVPSIATQQIPITAKGQDEFDLDFPFFPYLQTGQDFFVISGTTLVAKSRIDMKNQITMKIDGFDKNVRTGRNLTILYIYNSYYQINATRKLIVEWKDQKITSGIDNIDIPAPFEDYIENGWDYFVTYKNRKYLDDNNYDVFNNTFYTYPIADLNNKKYGDYITFTFIYLIKDPWVKYETKDDYDDNDENGIDLYFCKIPLEDQYSSQYMKDKSNWKSYDSMTLSDGWWDGYKYHDDAHQRVKKLIFQQKWNYSRTKYYSIVQEIDQEKYASIIGLFFSMLYDDKLFEKNLTIKIPSLSKDHEFNIAHLLIFLTILTYIYNGQDDFIIDNNTSQKYAVGFNFSTSLKAIKDYMVKNRIQEDKFPIWNMIIPTDQIPTIEEFINIFNINIDVYNLITKKMYASENYAEYKVWRYLYDHLMIWKFDLSYFKLPNGTIAKSYSQFLKYNDYILYSYIIKVRAMTNEETRIDSIVQFVDDIYTILKSYLGTDLANTIFDRYPGKSAMYAITYMMLMLEFFKSYKIIFRSKGQNSIIGKDGQENEDSTFRYFDDIKTLEETNYKNYYTTIETLDTTESTTITDKDDWLREDFKITKTSK